MPEDARAATLGHDNFEKHDEFLPTETMQTSEDPADLLPTVATVAVVGIGAAVFEAAILPGLVLGVAAMCVPRFYPQIGSALHPIFQIHGARSRANSPKDPRSACRSTGAGPGHRCGGRCRKRPRPQGLEGKAGDWIVRLIRYSGLRCESGL